MCKLARRSRGNTLPLLYCACDSHLSRANLQLELYSRLKLSWFSPISPRDPLATITGLSLFSNNGVTTSTVLRHSLPPSAHGQGLKDDTPRVGVARVGRPVEEAVLRRQGSWESYNSTTDSIAKAVGDKRAGESSSICSPVAQDDMSVPLLVRTGAITPPHDPCAPSSTPVPRKSWERRTQGRDHNQDFDRYSPSPCNMVGLVTGAHAREEEKKEKQEPGPLVPVAEHHSDQQHHGRSSASYSGARSPCIRPRASVVHNSTSPESMHTVHGDQCPIQGGESYAVRTMDALRVVDACTEDFVGGNTHDSLRSFNEVPTVSGHELLSPEKKQGREALLPPPSQAPTRAESGWLSPKSATRDVKRGDSPGAVTGAVIGQIWPERAVSQNCVAAVLEPGVNIACSSRARQTSALKAVLLPESDGSVAFAADEHEESAICPRWDETRIEAQDDHESIGTEEICASVELTISREDATIIDVDNRNGSVTISHQGEDPTNTFGQEICLFDISIDPRASHLVPDLHDTSNVNSVMLSTEGGQAFREESRTESAASAHSLPADVPDDMEPSSCDNPIADESLFVDNVDVTRVEPEGDMEAENTIGSETRPRRLSWILERPGCCPEIAAHRDIADSSCIVDEAESPEIVRHGSELQLSTGSTSDANGEHRSVFGRRSRDGQRSINSRAAAENQCDSIDSHAATSGIPVASQENETFGPALSPGLEGFGFDAGDAPSPLALSDEPLYEGEEDGFGEVWEWQSPTVAQLSPTKSESIIAASPVQATPVRSQYASFPTGEIRSQDGSSTKFPGVISSQQITVSNSAQDAEAEAMALTPPPLSAPQHHQRDHRQRRCVSQSPLGDDVPPTEYRNSNAKALSNELRDTGRASVQPERPGTVESDEADAPSATRGERSEHEQPPQEDHSGTVDFYSLAAARGQGTVTSNGTPPRCSEQVSICSFSESEMGDNHRSAIVEDDEKWGGVADVSLVEGTPRIGRGGVDSERDLSGFYAPLSVR